MQKVGQLKHISLAQMKENRKGKVAEVLGGPGLQNKFMSMGIYKGREITKISHFAMKGAVAIRVGRSVVALGHGMAAKIMLEA
ncbi:MAG: FeoA family protein [Candidatus Omnitrophica bacterium]|nr:FeoA family protein [Candidatus Omnitrophota bacterium]